MDSATKPEHDGERTGREWGPSPRLALDVEWLVVGVMYTCWKGLVDRIPLAERLRACLEILKRYSVGWRLKEQLARSLSVPGSDGAHATTPNCAGLLLWRKFAGWGMQIGHAFVLFNLLVG